MSETYNRTERLAELEKLPEVIDLDSDLALRRIYITDAERFSEIIARNPEIKSYVAWAKNVHSADDVLPGLQRSANEEMLGRFAIIEHDEIVGYAGILPGKQEREYGVSYFLDKDVRGKGYATGAVSALVDQAKTQLDAKHIYSQVIIGNDESAAVAKSLGFLPAEKVMGVDFPVPQQRYRLKLDS